MTPQKVIFTVLILIAVFILLLGSRSFKNKNENNRIPVVTMIDVRQAPSNDLRSYKVEIVLETSSRFVFNQYLRVNVDYLPDRDAVCAYSYDKTTGTGTWTQTFPRSNGTFQMFPEGDGYRIVQIRENGEFLTESLLVYSYK